MDDGPNLIDSISGASHPMGVMQRVTDRTLELIDPCRGVMVGLADPLGVTYVTGAGNQKALLGTHVSLDSSLSGVAVRTGKVQRSDDTELDGRVDLAACRRHSVRSLVCVPLRRALDTIGVLAVNSPEPRAFTSADVATLTRLAKFVSVAIGSACDLHEVSLELFDLEGKAKGASGYAGGALVAQRYVVSVLDPDEASRLEAIRRVQQVLDNPSLLGIAVQPVVDLVTDQTIAVEALSRFAVSPYRTPDLWFAEAHLCQRGTDLEMLALRHALAQLPALDHALSITVNLGPNAARSPQLEDILRDVPLERVVLELTEHAIVEDYASLNSALRPLRRRGMRVAIDDTGSGYSSLAHILKIAPDFIKLDGELTRGIDLDPVRRALAASLVAFAAETGADIIAEGVESEDELDVLRRLGVRFAQGYHLGRPGPVGAVTLSRAHRT